MFFPCFTGPSPVFHGALATRKDLALRERNLVVKNITWVFDKDPWSNKMGIQYAIIFSSSLVVKKG